MCGWWNRWWHHRLREADALYLLPLLRVLALAHTDDPLEVEQLVDRAFAAHASLPGQEHWRCPCSQRELWRYGSE